MNTLNPQEAMTTIKPSKGWVPLHLKDLWDSHELLFFLVWRDVTVKYKQTFFGVAWAVIQPVTMMVIFSIFFGRLAKIPSDNLPYPLFTLSALIPWAFFSSALSNSSNSLVGSANLIKKVYFPRIIIPIASVASGLLDFAIAFLILLVVMLGYGILPTLNILWVPVFVILAMLTSLAAGVWLSALNVEYRDVRYVVPFMIQIWFYVTPIAYPSSLLQGTWRTVYSLNPMVGVIEGFRWALFGTGAAPGGMLLLSTSVTLLTLFGGLAYFKRMENNFADIV